MSCTFSHDMSSKSGFLGASRHCSAAAAAFGAGGLWWHTTDTPYSVCNVQYLVSALFWIVIMALSVILYVCCKFKKNCCALLHYTSHICKPLLTLSESSY